MDSLNIIKTDLERYYGMSIDVDENSTLEEWSSEIKNVEDFLSNEISDNCSKFYQRMTNAHSEKILK
jgi:hypothetical protein